MSKQPGSVRSIAKEEQQHAADRRNDPGPPSATTPIVLGMLMAPLFLRFAFETLLRTVTAGGSGTKTCASAELDAVQGHRALTWIRAATAQNPNRTCCDEPAVAASSPRHLGRLG